MSIAYDNSSNSGYQSTTASYSWSHTVTGSNVYLVVGVALFTSTQTVSGITYNGVALSLLKTQADGTATRSELWGLAAPATGAHTVAVTLSGSTNSAAGAISLTGVAQTASTEGANGASGSGASDASVDVTTVADNDWVIDCTCGTDGSITVGAGQTSRMNVTGLSGSGAMSTEGPKTPAGAVTMSWSGFAGLTKWSIAGIALTPVQLTTTITSNADDGTWYATGSGFDIDLVNGDCVGENTGSGLGICNAFYRFGLGAGHGDTIISAKLTLTARSNAPGTTCRLRIKAIAEDSAAAPTSYADAQGRSVTTAYVDWTPDPWTVGTAYESPELATVFQEIINRVSWAANGPIVLYVLDNGSDTNAFRRPYKFEDLTAPAYITVSWNTGTAYNFFTALITAQISQPLRDRRYVPVPY